MTFIDVTELGEGSYSAFFVVYKIDVSSSDVFKEPIQTVKATDGYRVSAINYARGLPTITRSTVIMTSDDVPIIYFVKKGMTFPHGEKGTDLAATSLQAIKTLVIKYPPTKKLKSNVRHSANLEDELSKSKELNREYGVYHWAIWRPKGQRDPCVSAEARPDKPAHQDALQRFWAQTSWEGESILHWLRSLEPESFARYQACYERLRREKILGVLDEGKWGCQSGRTLLINAVANPHKDPRDVTRGWTMTYPWGDYTGGEAVFPGLGLKFAQESEDLLMSPAAVLEHMIMPHTSGDRFSNVRFTKADIMDPPVIKYFCDVPGCSHEGFATKGGLKAHKEGRNDDEHQAARNIAEGYVAPETLDPDQMDLDEQDPVDESAPSSSHPSPIRETAPRKFVDRRPRHHCKVIGCNKTVESGFEGYVKPSGVKRHANEKHGR